MLVAKLLHHRWKRVQFPRYNTRQKELNQNRYAPAFSWISLALFHNRYRILSEYSDLMGIGITSTDSSKDILFFPPVVFFFVVPGSEFLLSFSLLKDTNAQTMELFDFEDHGEENKVVDLRSWRSRSSCRLYFNGSRKRGTLWRSRDGIGDEADGGWKTEAEEALALVYTSTMPILLRNLLLTWWLVRMIFGFKMGAVEVVAVTMEPDDDEVEEDVVERLEEDLKHVLGGRWSDGEKGFDGMSLFEETLEFGLAILMDLIDSMFVMRAMRKKAEKVIFCQWYLVIFTLRTLLYVFVGWYCQYSMFYDKIS